MASITPDTKIVLITGANQGIGYSITKTLTTQNKNYHVLMGCRTLSKGETAAAELKKEGCSVEPIQLDVTDDSSITSAASSIKEKYGHIDILINNAGIVRPESETQPRPVFQEVFNTNVFGAFTVTQFFTPLLNASPSKTPKVLFISSTLGSLGTYAENADADNGRYLPVYRSSKAAVNMVALHFRSVGKERGWEVNCVCPGFVKTNLNGYRGTGSLESGAVEACRLVVEGGVTGSFSNKNGKIPW